MIIDLAMFDLFRGFSLYAVSFIFFMCFFKFCIFLFSYFDLPSFSDLFEPEITEESDSEDSGELVTYLDKEIASLIGKYDELDEKTLKDKKKKHKKEVD